jgi:hypothetical protein
VDARPLDVLDHRERFPEHPLVVAEQHRVRRRHAGGREPLHHRVLRLDVDEPLVAPALVRLPNHVRPGVPVSRDPYHPVQPHLRHRRVDHLLVESFREVRRQPLGVDG